MPGVSSREPSKKTGSDRSPSRQVAEGATDQILLDQMLRKNTLVVPRKIVFGRGTARCVGDEVATIGAQRVLLVTDPQVLESNVLTDVTESLRSKGLDVRIFSDVEAEPDIKIADRVACVVRGREFGLVCGVGGGSVLDIAKIASVMATNPGETRHYIGVDLIRRPGLPKILVPTTAGTGSEMTPNAIVGLHDTGTKAGIISPYVLADIAIVDPLLAMTLPPRSTASSGLDALTHAIESYISVDANPITSVLSQRAIGLIARNLPTAFSEGASVRARSAMSLAAMMGGISIANAGTCSGHAAAYGYATKYGIPHGFSVAVALPYILEFSLVSCPEKAKAIAEAMGETVSGLSSAEVVMRTVQAVVNLMKKVQCPMSLSQLGIPRTEIPSIAQEMLKIKRLMIHNPRPVTESQALEIVGNMWEGKAA